MYFAIGIIWQKNMAKCGPSSIGRICYQILAKSLLVSNSIPSLALANLATSAAKKTTNKFLTENQIRASQPQS